MAIESPARPALRRVPFEALRAFPPLFTTYCSRDDAVLAFYAGDFQRAEARRAAAEQAAALGRDRATLVRVLLGQNERWGLDGRTRAHIEALRDPDAVAVVTGQQVGLLGGPLYTPYKTVTTLQLARQLAEETGRPVVPVFWLEGEDHDFEEVAAVHLLHHNTPVPVRYANQAAPEGANRGPVGRLRLTEAVHEVLDRVDEVLRPSDFKETLMQQVRAAYQPGTTLLDAFARLMRTFFPESGLVFINPDDARLKRLAAPLFRREIEDYEALAAGLRSVSEALEARFHAQVRVRPTNLFLLEEDGRHAIDVDPADGADRFTLRGKPKTFTQEALLDLLERAPERFSPNVVLRPLMQDLLLPTAAYVAGPGEVSYFAQFKPAYAWAELPMPVIYPRASVTLVESKVQKVLDRYHLSLAEVEEDLDQLFRRLVLRELDVDVDAVFKEALRHVHEAVTTLKPEVERVDRTLVKSAEATRAALVKEMERFKGRVVKAEQRNQDAVRMQLEKAQVNLFPGGQLQERMLSALYFLNKYGPDLLAELQTVISLDTTSHQVVMV